jgi:hypothetical protein
MGVQAASLLVLFLTCCYSNFVPELHANILLPEGDSYKNWTINYLINSVDPNIVLANNKAMLDEVANLTKQVEMLTANLIIGNNTDYIQMENLTKEIDKLATNLIAIQANYTAAVTASRKTQSMLDEVNALLDCYKDAPCVTGVSEPSHVVHEKIHL